MGFYVFEILAFSAVGSATFILTWHLLCRAEKKMIKKNAQTSPVLSPPPHRGDRAEKRAALADASIEDFQAQLNDRIEDGDPSLLEVLRERDVATWQFAYFVSTLSERAQARLLRHKMATDSRQARKISDSIYNRWLLLVRQDLAIKEVVSDLAFCELVRKTPKHHLREILFAENRIHLWKICFGILSEKGKDMLLSKMSTTQIEYLRKSYSIVSYESIHITKKNFEASLAELHERLSEAATSLSFDNEILGSAMKKKNAAPARHSNHVSRILPEMACEPRRAARRPVPKKKSSGTQNL